MSIAPKTEEAIDFLTRIQSPGGPWAITAINPEGGPTETATFTADQMETMTAWLAARNGKVNLYFGVNPVRWPVTKKAAREDIAAMTWLHVDLDPEPGENFDAERARILSSLRSPPGDLPLPTLIIDSGGGYQAFWKLAEPFAINGEEELFEKAALYNKQIETIFNADHCHDVSRVMRLPGTVNLPNSKKRAKGRKPAMACVADFNEQHIYPLSAFTPALSSPSTGTPPKAKIEGDIRRLVTVEDLGKEVKDKVKVIIVQGHDPDDPKRWPSRSEILMYVTCALVRSGISDKVIYSVITDPGFGISESVLEKKQDAHRYAIRQIERAKANVAAEKPRILLGGGQLGSIVDQAEQALLRYGASVYQRGQELVRVTQAETLASEDGVRRVPHATILLSVSDYWLVEQLARSALWFKISKDDKLVPVDPSQKYARHLLARVGEWRFPVLRGLALTPTLAVDGRVIQQPGYDVESGLLVDFAANTFPAIPDAPSRDDAVAAIGKLKHLLRGFPFVDDASRSVALSAILSGLVRRTLRTVPLHAFDAPTAGTGKSYLADTVGILMTGSKPAAMSQGKSAEEDEKRLAAVLRTGDPVLLIDNCERYLEGDFLCSMLTQEVVQARILGYSERMRLSSNVLVMATGNNLVVNGDMSRRTVVCRLDAKKERPDERVFTWDVRQEASANRGELVAAALTALRAYIAAGRPRQLTDMGSFEDWSLVRETLVWAGEADPAKTRERILAQDPRKAELSDLLNLWHSRVGSAAFTLAELRSALITPAGTADGDELSQLLVEMTGRPQWNPRSVGKMLERHRDRVVGGLCLKAANDNHKGVKRWRVVDVEHQRTEPEVQLRKAQGQMPF